MYAFLKRNYCGLCNEVISTAGYSLTAVTGVRFEENDAQSIRLLFNLYFKDFFHLSTQQYKAFLVFVEKISNIFLQKKKQTISGWFIYRGLQFFNCTTPYQKQTNKQNNTIRGHVSAHHVSFGPRAENSGFPQTNLTQCVRTREDMYFSVDTQILILDFDSHLI